MLELRKILFPVDFSKRCAAIAGQVAAMARHFNAQVTLLNVVQTQPLWYGDPASPPFQVWIDPAETIQQSKNTLHSYLAESL